MRVYCFECEKIWQQPDITGEWLGECPHCGNQLYLLDPRGQMNGVEARAKERIMESRGDERIPDMNGVELRGTDQSG